MSFHQGSGAITSTEDRRTRAHLDIPLLIITYALAVFGVYCIAIATFNPDKGTDLSVLNYILNSSSASWQAIFCLVSPIVLGFLVAIPYELLRIQGRLVYYGIVGLLILALFSQAISGVTAWIPIGKGRTIQPAEFIKIGIILMMARSLSNTDKPFGTMRNAAYNLGIFLLPAGLTLLQGELGSVLVMCVIFYVMLYFADTETWVLITILVLAVVGIGAILGYMMVSGSESYRLKRILSFLDPQAYYNSAGYQILNSQLAIGSGGKTGITFVFDCGFVWVVALPTAMALARLTSVSIVPMFAICQAIDLIKCLIGYILVKKDVWIHNLVVE